MLLALACVFLSPPARASAHAVLVRSDPPNGCALLPQRLPPDDPRCAAGAVLATPPTGVHLWFSEPVQPFAGGITVLGPSGKRADRGPVRTSGLELSVDMDAAESGTYLVRWRIISGDTHPARGDFAFSVGHASATPGSIAAASNEVGGVSPSGLYLQTLARWLHLIGFALGFGPISFLLLVLRPLSSRPNGLAEQRIRRLVNAGVLAMAVAGPAALLAQALSLSSLQALDAATIGDILSSSFGRILALQMGATLLLWMLLGAIEYGSASAALGALGTGLALAFVDGGASHAIGVTPAWLGLALNAAHLSAMGAWAGGLVALLTTWQTPELRGQQTVAVRRFGRVAALCLAILVASGAATAWLLLGRQTNLLDSAYARTLAGKALIVLAVALLAYIGTRAAAKRRRTWWAFEAAGLASVLALAGLLVSLPPR